MILNAKRMDIANVQTVSGTTQDFAQRVATALANGWLMWGGITTVVGAIEGRYNQELIHTAFFVKKNSPE